MKRGEWVVLGLVGALAVAGVVQNIIHHEKGDQNVDRGVPFYTTATPELAREGSDLIRQNDCRQCHSLWSVRNIMQSVPSPSLDGMGDLRSEAWLYQYLSSTHPQALLPSRLKPEYRMPSFAMLPEQERRTLAHYLASLHVKDWYLEETKKSEYEKLTGKDDYKK
ncbi:Cytochrome c [mine drainage metagenome]|uniref:Cytochrome c n=1 Tax=mine drainage metagenome TaxID=410659 RepID=A0A3P3ZR74_9ZZZZ